MQYLGIKICYNQSSVFFSFGETLHRCEKNQTNVIHTKVFFEKNGPKTPDFEEYLFEIVIFR